MCPIRVAIVDDHPVVLEGLRGMLRMEPDIELCSEASSGEEALLKVVQATPDVVLMDIRMPGMGGIEATRKIKQLSPQIKVIILTVYSEQYLAQAMEAGAQGYILKDIKREELVKAVRSAYMGQIRWCGPEGLQSSSPLSGLLKRISLSPRQRQVLQLVASGTTNKEIAYRLHLSDTTVKREIRSIFDKLGAADRAEAVSLAYRQGLL